MELVRNICQTLITKKKRTKFRRINNDTKNRSKNCHGRHEKLSSIKRDAAAMGLAGLIVFFIFLVVIAIFIWWKAPEAGKKLVEGAKKGANVAAERVVQYVDEEEKRLQRKKSGVRRSPLQKGRKMSSMNKFEYGEFRSVSDVMKQIALIEKELSDDASSDDDLYFDDDYRDYNFDLGDREIASSDFIPTPPVYIKTGDRAGKVKNVGEQLCRMELERVFKRHFPSVIDKYLIYSPLTQRALEIDCYCADMKLGLEFNGVQHYEFPSRWIKEEEKFLAQVWNDKYKERECERLGITLIEVDGRSRDYKNTIDSLHRLLTGELGPDGDDRVWVKTNIQRFGQILRKYAPKPRVLEIEDAE